MKRKSKVGFMAAVLMLLVFTIPVKAEKLTPEQQAQLNDYYQQAWQYLGQMHKNVNNLDKAHAIYQKALSLSPNNAKTCWKIAEILFKKAQETKDEKAAKELYQQALISAQKSEQINPKSVAALYWIGTCQAKQAEMAGVFKAMGLVKSAKNKLNQCIELAPDDRFAILARVILAVLYTEPPWPLRNLREADKLTAKAVSLDPNLTLASVKRAKVHIKNGDNPLAQKELERCLHIKNPTYVWDSELYDWPEAKKLLAQIQ